ncbi:MAG: polysaccharide biosynthesis C-terminal domain-containing protein, partial [Candidatus Micrarchaeota archaeon]|nr:polysaccharide biosynthesis C-terminal domain-containing protein [Candidatus Micrarchaeota archaeon]
MLEAAKMSLKSVFTNFFSFVFYLSFGILYMILLYKYAPIEVVSDYFLIVSLIAISGLALSNIISFSCNYQLPEVYHKSRKEAMMLIFISVILSGLISGIVVFAIMQLGIIKISIMDNLTLAVYVMFYNISINSIGYLGNMLWIREKLIFSSIQPIFRFLVIGYLVFQNGSLSGQDITLFLFAVSAFYFMVLLYIFAKEGLDFRYLKQGYGWMMKGLSNGLWFYIDNLGSTLLSSIDSFMLGAFNLKDRIAGYNAALGPSKYIQTAVPGNIGSGLFPVLRSGKFKEDNSTIIEYGVKWTILLIYPLTIAAFLFADRIIAVLSPGYMDYAYIARIIILGFLLTPISMTIKQILQSVGRAKFVATTTLMAAIVNIIMNLIFFFVFNMGYVGVAVATAISNMLIDIILIRFSNIISLKTV